MEKNEISIHEIKVYHCFVSSPDQWLTNSSVAAQTGVNGRTVRAHTMKLVDLGLLDQAEVFPAHRYRLSSKADKRNKSYLQRLERAAEVFGIAINA